VTVGDLEKHSFLAYLKTAKNREALEDQNPHWERLSGFFLPTEEGKIGQ
jgi:hypothetical protein